MRLFRMFLWSFSSCKKKNVNMIRKTDTTISLSHTHFFPRELLRNSSHLSYLKFIYVLPSVYQDIPYLHIHLTVASDYDACEAWWITATTKKIKRNKQTSHSRKKFAMWIQLKKKISLNIILVWHNKFIF